MGVLIQQTFDQSNITSTYLLPCKAERNRLILQHWMLLILSNNVLHTCTLASAKLIFFATSSRIKTSGYIVLLKRSSKTSSCALVNVVRSLRRFGGAAETNMELKIERFTITTPSDLPYHVDHNHTQPMKVAINRIVFRTSNWSISGSVNRLTDQSICASTSE